MQLGRYEWFSLEDLLYIANVANTGIKVTRVAPGKLAEVWFPKDNLPQGIFYHVGFQGIEPIFVSKLRDRTYEHSGSFRFRVPSAVCIYVYGSGPDAQDTKYPVPRKEIIVCSNDFYNGRAQVTLEYVASLAAADFAADQREHEERERRAHIEERIASVAEDILTGRPYTPRMSRFLIAEYLPILRRVEECLLQNKS